MTTSVRCVFTQNACKSTCNIEQNKVKTARARCHFITIPGLINTTTRRLTSWRSESLSLCFSPESRCPCSRTRNWCAPAASEMDALRRCVCSCTQRVCNIFGIVKVYAVCVYFMTVIICRRANRVLWGTLRVLRNQCQTGGSLECAYIIWNIWIFRSACQRARCVRLCTPRVVCVFKYRCAKRVNYSLGARARAFNVNIFPMQTRESN